MRIPLLSVVVILTILLVSNCKFDQWKQVAQVDPPSPRYNFDGACYNDNILVFGGRGETWLNFTSDTHLFNYHTKTWQHLNYSSAEAPLPRFGAALAIIKGKLYMFGGAYYTPSNVLVYLNDTWQFSFDTKRWTQETTTGTIIPIYEGHTFSSEAQDTLCVFGGHNSDTSVFDSTFCYNVNTKVWTNETDNYKNVPYRRFGALIQSIDDTRSILFGGRTNLGGNFLIKPADFLNDTWIVDMNTKTWEEIKIPINLRPKQRYNTQGTIIRDARNQIDYFVIYGGENLVALQKPPIYEYTSDTWVLNLKTREWTDMTPEAGTGPMGRSAAISCPYNNFIHMWGGKRNYNDPDEIIYNDMWGVWAGSLIPQPSAAIRPIISVLAILLTVVALAF